MRKFILCSVSSLALFVSSGQAMSAPVVALVANGVGFWASVAAVYGTGWAIIGQIGLSLLLSRVAASMVSKPKQDQTRLELTRPNALPAYRFVYGQTWAPGTPVGWVVRGDILYICYLLNSRPSALTNHTVLFDKRSVEYTGNPFNFAGPGATATNDPFAGRAQYWIGRGNQTTCPAQIVSGSAYFQSTDAWRGRTVLWARLDCGPNNERTERWPSTPPELNVEGDWSLIHNPETNTTAFSRNQGLIVRDALRMNPLRPYTDNYLWTETFEWAMDVANEMVLNKDGTQTRRYCCDGVLVWSTGTELEDQIQPLLDAGGSRLIRVGGRLGIVPATWRASVHTITDFTDGQPAEMTRWRPGEELATECVSSYVAPDRAFENADSPTYVVPGAQAADGGEKKQIRNELDFVQDHRQAQRLNKIAAMRSRMQRQISWELFPTAAELVACSRATVNLPWPYTAWNGEYEVESVNIASGINDDESITLRVPCVIRETSEAVYAWNAATEEQDVEGANFDGTIARVLPPLDLVVFSGSAAAVDDGGQVTPRVGATWASPDSPSVRGFEWQFATLVVGVWVWREGGTVSVGADLRAFVSPVVVGDSYRVRVRTLGIYGTSTWTESAPIVAAAPTETTDPPEIITATGGPNRVDLVVRQAADPRATFIEIFMSTAPLPAFATRIANVAAGASVSIARRQSGLSGATEYFFWARASNSWGEVSDYSAVASATTD